MILLLAIGVEVYQSIQHTTKERSLFRELTVGATADPWDLLSYAVGLIGALWLEHHRVREVSGQRPH